MKKAVSVAVKVLVSALLIRFIFTRIDIGDVAETLAHMHAGYFALAVGLSFGAHFLSTLKWHVLLKPVAPPVSIGALFRLNLASAFYTMFLPGGQLAGQAAKAYRALDIPGDGAQLVSSVIVDRMTGLLPTLMLGLFAIMVTPTPIEIYEQVVLLFVVMTAGTLASFLTFHSRIYAWLSALFERWSLGIKSGIVDKFVRLVHAGSVPYMDRFDLLAHSSLWGVLFQLVNTLTLLMLARALSIDILLINLLWVFALVSIILLVPTSIMGLGQREISFVFLLGLIAVTPAASTSLSFAFFIASLVAALAGGVIEARFLLGR
ncbi:MAG: flippase-like domain-containing protein [Candidatus Vogelbacteria bacterium]|nr:flippase-like domain-containing protein [Candidatus Vogelbacteria bacterium]